MEVGARLRALRELYGLSQRELAKRAGVTNGMISQIEQDRVSPSIGSLKKILDGLAISIADFFTQDFGGPVQVFFERAAMPDLGNGPVNLFLVAAARKNRQMSMLREVYAPGADTGEDMLQHEGEEAGVVVRGRMEITVGSETRVLEPGDAYYFESRIPHRFRNPGIEEAEIVSANSPPTF
ncbi:XRE family transcriptional regulator [Acidihalobacter yilgarnensis]|uniref:XRE family transcriptional regulator n=1 Tax=Acidihalobacter yilgarnensis TaxID=2819280 RepID=A0A1D8ILT4_9GAMM|nr:cupin domain-containing protein [Acidihalobacter yilgarnensis]AOU97409.1 XRE family transcriptional regulator [Acidihalobacter yilgarnensis]